MYTHYNSGTSWEAPLPISFLHLGAFLPVLIVLAIVVLVLKGYSLWYAARGSQKWWFIILLIVNTFGILEIVYLLFFRPSAPYRHVVQRRHRQ